MTNSTGFFSWFFDSNSTGARLVRTIVQGVLGVVVSYLTVIAANAPEIVSLLVIPVVMAILSPIMAEIGNVINKDDDGAPNE